MNQLELNIRKSFAEVRKDIIEIKNQILRLAEGQEELAKMISKNANGHSKTKVVERVKVVQAKTKAKTYVSSKEGKKFHIPECPYAKNILPKSKSTFKSKDAALNKGYKPCSCVK